jgi:four helix bundle protein
MSTVRSFRDLEAWNVAMALVEIAYRVTAVFPEDERFGLRQQIRRAAVSIPSNIAEGHNGRTRAEFLRHLRIATGSQAELETQVELANRFGLLSPQDAAAIQMQTARAGQLLFGLIRALRAKP